MPVGRETGRALRVRRDEARRRDPARRGRGDAAWHLRWRCTAVPGLCAGDEGRRGEAGRRLGEAGGTRGVGVVVVGMAVVVVVVAAVVVTSTTSAAATTAVVVPASSATVPAAAAAVLVALYGGFFALGEDGCGELDACQEHGFVGVAGGEGRHFVVDSARTLVQFIVKGGWEGRGG